MTNFTPLEELLLRSVPSPSEKYASNLRELNLRAYDRDHRPALSKRNLVHRKQTLGWAGALVPAIFAFMTLTSTGRALAQQILQFSRFIFTNEPSKAEEYLTATPDIYYLLRLFEQTLQKPVK